MENAMEFVNVAVRIRPQSIQDSMECNLKVISNNPPMLSVSDKHFNFDHIFDGDSNQVDVFNDTIRPMIDKCLMGYDCTVFAYGQTGTGKTYTMSNTQTDEENMGMINRTLKEIFGKIDENMEIYAELSLYEIYNEKVYDLLNNEKVPLAVKGFVVPDLKRVPIFDLTEAQQLLSIASKNRKTGGTLQNPKSSRSHAVYTLYCKISNGGTMKSSKFNFVDLAGCESVRKTGSAGNTFHEGININKGLLCLGQVINALSCNQKHIPYRQALITTTLKDSLSKQNFITLIACVSSKIIDTTETLQTLDFARRVKKIGNKPEAFSIIDNSFKKPSIDTSKYLTPMKSFGPIQTSTILRKPRGVPLPPKFPIHLENIEEPPFSVSPIVRRCVAEIESKLFSKINSLVNEQTQIILRRSTRISNLPKKYNDENRQSSGKKRFKYDDSKASPLQDITKINNNKDNGNKNSSSINIFDTQYSSKSLATRNTSRLQKTSTPSGTRVYNEFVKPLDADKTIESSLAGTRREMMESKISPIMSISLRRSRRISKQPLRLNVGDVHKPKSGKNNDKTNNMSKRKNVSDTPSKVVKKQKVENHSEKILRILNEGNLKTLITLHTIGQKTAEQIILFRELRGNFKTIEDIKGALMRGKSFQRFLEANFLI